MTLPFENDTDSIIQKISTAELHHDKLKKRISVLAIALATFLMSAVLLLISGITIVNMNGGNSVTGSYHALASNITQEQYKKLSTDQRIKLLGFNAFVEGIKTGSDHLNVSCSNTETLMLNGLSISAGRMPEQENEILVEKEYLLSQKIDAEIGDTISLPFAGEQKKKDFIISGYLQTATKGTDRTLYAAIVSMKYFEAMDGWNTLAPAAMFQINSITKNQTDIIDTVKQISFHAEIEETPSVNESYIKLSQPSVFLIATAVAGMAIIIMASVLVIYCIFYISIINSIKEYGQLRTIGMTAKQIKRLVFKQGCSLTLTAIPIGLVFGIILSYVLIPQGFRVSNLLWVCPIVAILVYITVLLSIRKPAIIAATVSPIEASRYEVENSIARSDKHQRLTPMALAKGQMVHYKKKNLLTIASLTLTGVLLLGLSSILSSISARDMSLSGFESGQFHVRFTTQELSEFALEQTQSNSPFTDEVYHSLSKISGIEELTVFHDLPVSNDLQSQESNAAIVGFEPKDMNVIQSCSSTGDVPSYEIMASQNQLVVGRADDFESYFGMQPKVGAFVTLKIFDGKQSKNMQFEIASILDQNKIGNHGDKIDMLLLPISSMKELANTNLTYQYSIRVDENFEQQAEKEIEQILTSNPRLNVTTLSAAITQNENFLQGMKLALTVIIAFIGCFSLMNLVNTILTGIIVRRKEFSLMRSVGMTQKQLSTMVSCEGLIIVSIGLALSLVVGGGIGYVLCSFLQSGIMSYLSYQFPLAVAITYGTLVLLCTIATTAVALKHQSKFSMIETIRK